MLVDVKEREIPFCLLESGLLSVKFFQHTMSCFEVFEQRGGVGEMGCHYFCCKKEKGRETKKEKRKSRETENENGNVLNKFLVFNIFSNSLPGVICFGFGR
jgi:hypothetical protein